MNQLLTYGIIGVVVVYMFIAKVLPLFKKRTVATDNSDPAEPLRIVFNSASGLSAGQYKKIILSAIYSVQQSGAFMNTLETGVEKAAIKEALSDSWGIHNTEEARIRVGYLRDKGFRFYFPAVMQAWETGSEEGEDAVIRNSFTDEEDMEKALSQVFNLKESLPELKADGIIKNDSDVKELGVVGWDAGRIVFLTRLCYDAGYLAVEEAWSYIDAAAQLAWANFTGWESFGKSYVMGRAMWGGTNCGNREIAAICQFLLKDPRSPWLSVRW